MIKLNTKTGIKETSLSVSFLVIAPFFFFFVGNGIQKLASGYVINTAMCFAFCFVILLLFKKAFVAGFEKNTLSSRIFLALCSGAVFFLTLYIYLLCTDSIEKISSDFLSADMLFFLPLFSAAILSLGGGESLTRCGYLSMFGVVGMFIVLCIVSFKGWDRQNIYPILGTDVKEIFTDIRQSGVFGVLFSSVILKDKLRTSDGAYKTARRSLVFSFLFVLLLTLVSLVAVPYPMGGLYPFSLSALFAVTSSGSFFHRFEIVLVFTSVIIEIIALATGLYISSCAISDLTTAEDTRPFSLVLSLVLFFCGKLFTDANAVYVVYLGFLFASFVLLVINLLSAKVRERI